jgi:hypothetical protein
MIPPWNWFLAGTDSSYLKITYKIEVSWAIGGSIVYSILVPTLFLLGS